MDTDMGTPEYIAMQARTRRETCNKIAAYARNRGLDVSWSRVNRQLPIWERWYTCAMSTGYLMRQTGVKYVGSIEANRKEVDRIVSATRGRLRMGTAKPGRTQEGWIQRRTPIPVNRSHQEPVDR